MQKLIQKAKDLVSGTEEPYHSLAFSVVLAGLLRATPVEREAPKKEVMHKETPKASVAGKGRLETILRSNVDWSSLPILNSEPIVQNLIILRLALDDFKIDGLSARDIQQILFQKYRVSKTPNAVSMSLMAAVGKYVDRIQEGKEFLYRITQKGIARLNEKKQSEGKKWMKR
ncbi:MAG: hypothetical protein JRM94_04755 [Nitrososphaerota archaeon]|nr:hypothetical protein [Nitrososphaerota archaeon]